MEIHIQKFDFNTADHTDWENLLEALRHTIEEHMQIALWRHLDTYTTDDVSICISDERPTKDYGVPGYDYVYLKEWYKRLWNSELPMAVREALKAVWNVYISRLQHFVKAFDPKDVLILTPSDQYEFYVKSVTKGLAIQSITEQTLEKYYADVTEIISNRELKTNLDVVVSDWNVTPEFVEYIYSDDFLETFEDSFDSVLEERVELFSNVMELLQNAGLETQEYPDNESIVPGILRDAVNQMKAASEEREKEVEKKRKTLELQRQSAVTLEEELEKARNAAADVYLSAWDSCVNKLRVAINTMKQSKDAESRFFVEIVSDFIKEHRNPTATEIPKLLYQALQWEKSIIEDYKKYQSAAENLSNVQKEIDNKPAVIAKAEIDLEEAENALITDEMKSRVEAYEKEISSWTALGCYRKSYVMAIQDELDRLGIKQPGKVHRFNLYARLLFSLMYYDTESAGYSFICVDEGQDIAYNEYRLLKDLNPSAWFNIYGDVRQMIHPERGIDDWNAIQPLFNMKTYELNENYRNSKQINEYCNDHFDMNVMSVGIPGASVEKISTKIMVDQIGKKSHLKGERWAILIPKAMKKKRVEKMLSQNT